MRTQRRWLAVGLMTVALGVATLVIGAVLVSMRDGGYPWHASITSTTSGLSTASVEDRGTVRSFTGTSEAAQRWLYDEEARLKDEHGITTRTETGEVLLVVGIILLIAGAAVVVVKARRGRTTVPAQNGARA